jgi:hypothetical protein
VTRKRLTQDVSRKRAANVADARHEFALDVARTGTYWLMVARQQLPYVAESTQSGDAGLCCSPNGCSEP